MRRLWIVMVAVLAFGGFAALAPSAGAASKPSAKFCKEVDKIGDSNESDLPYGDQAEGMGRQFKKAAKYAPNSKTKKAMTQLGSFFGNLGDIDNVADLSSVYTGKGMQNYLKNIGIYLDVTIKCSMS
jgi:hypothetical protein